MRTCLTNRSLHLQYWTVHSANIAMPMQKRHTGICALSYTKDRKGKPSKKWCTDCHIMKMHRPRGSRPSSWQRAKNPLSQSCIKPEHLPSQTESVYRTAKSAAEG